MRETLTRLRYRYWPDHLLGEILSKRWTETAIPVIVLLIVGFALSRMIDNFLSPSSLADTARQAGEIGFIALGEALVVIVGGIDLSVGSMFALTDFCALYHPRRPRLAGCRSDRRDRGLRRAARRGQRLSHRLSEAARLHHDPDHAHHLPVGVRPLDPALFEPDCLSLSRFPVLELHRRRRRARRSEHRHRLSRGGDLRAHLPDAPHGPAGTSPRSAARGARPTIRASRSAARSRSLCRLRGADRGRRSLLRRAPGHSRRRYRGRPRSYCANGDGARRHHARRRQRIGDEVGGRHAHRPPDHQRAYDDERARRLQPHGAGEHPSRRGDDRHPLAEEPNAHHQQGLCQPDLSRPAASADDRHRQGRPVRAERQAARRRTNRSRSNSRRPKTSSSTATTTSTAGSRHGDIIRFFAPDYQRMEVFAHIGGQPLGMAFDRNDNLYICIGGMGLYRIAPDGKVEQATDETNRSLRSVNDDSRLRLADDLDISDRWPHLLLRGDHPLRDGRMAGRRARGARQRPHHLLRHEHRQDPDRHPWSQVPERHLRRERRPVDPVRRDLRLLDQALLVRRAEEGPYRGRHGQPARLSRQHQSRLRRQLLARAGRHAQPRARPRLAHAGLPHAHGQAPCRSTNGCSPISTPAAS